jgi:outer membrane protein
MKNLRLIALAGLLAMFTVFLAQAQPRPAATQTPSAPAGPVPETKIAFVDTQAFQDSKVGIARYVAAVTSLDREFQPRQQELATLQNQLNSIADELNKLNAGSNTVVDPKTLQSKQEQGEKLQREFKYKKELYDADAAKRYREVVGPISEDIGKALDAFAKARGISMILDISKIAQAVLSVNDSMDVTKQFIAEYNSKNPSTASAATPGRP